MGKVKICLNLIIKEEPHTILRCFNNVGHLIDAIAIVDTGSPPETIEAVNKYMIDNNIPGEIIVRPWYEFGASRTEAMRHCEDVIFRIAKGQLGPGGTILNENSIEHNQRLSYQNSRLPTGPVTPKEFKIYEAQIMGRKYTGLHYKIRELEHHKMSDLKGVSWYCMFMDADNELFSNDDIHRKGDIKFVFDKNKMKADVYDIDMKQLKAIYGYTWIVKIHPNRRFCWLNRRHEYVDIHGGWKPKKKYIRGAYIYSGRDSLRNKDPLKYLHDAIILEEDMVDNPNDERTVFYAAQSYKDAKHWYRARELYLKRAEMGKWPEEVYMSYLEAAKCSMLLDKDDKKTILEYFYKAFGVRPQRLEAPYYIMVILCEDKNYVAAWPIAYFVKDLEYPKDDILFVDEEIHKFKFWDQAAACAAKGNDIKSCLEFSEKSLNYPYISDGDRKRIMGNVELCQQELAKREQQKK